MAISQRQRYAAKEAYRLAIYNGIYTSRICNLDCKVNDDHVTVVDILGDSVNVKVAKSWL